MVDRDSWIWTADGAVGAYHQQPKTIAARLLWVIDRWDRRGDDRVAMCRQSLAGLRAGADADAVNGTILATALTVYDETDGDVDVDVDEGDGQD